MATEFDTLLSTSLADFLKLSKKIGGDVQEQGVLVEKCFNIQSQFLKQVSVHSAPTDSILKEFIEICSQPIASVVKFKDSKRSSQFFNHLSAVAESILALGWIGVSPTPAPYVKSMREAAEFFTNRIIKEYKEKNPDHVAWTKALLIVWDELHNFVKRNHTTGLSWNVKGTPATVSALQSLQPGRAAGSSPHLPLKPTTYSTTQSKSGTSGPGDLFTDLNRGESVTSGLRKVTDDMKTHKNPNLRGQVDVSDSGGKPTVEPAKPRTGVLQGKAVLELRGNKWVVENFRGEELKITDTAQKQTVYIYNCVECVVKIEGKLNSISMDQCKKTGLVFDSLISSLEIVNCQNAQVQSLGQLSTVTIDKTDSCQVYLSNESKAASILTAKSSAVNILIPTASGEFDEYPVPEQFKTKFTGTGLHTVPAENLD